MMSKFFSNSSLKFFGSLYLFLAISLIASLWLLHNTNNATDLTKSGTDQTAIQKHLPLSQGLSFKLIAQDDTRWLGLFNSDDKLVWLFSRHDLKVLNNFILALLISYWPLLLIAFSVKKQQATNSLWVFITLSSLLYLFVLDWLTLGLTGQFFIGAASIVCILCSGYFVVYQNGLISKLQDPAEIMLGYATQSGKAAQLAKSFAQTMTKPCHIMDLATARPEDLSAYEQALFIVSTYGEGEPPEGVRNFFKKLQKSNLRLENLSYSILALGDQQYPEFCAFGHSLNTELQGLGAQSFAPLQEVNQENPTHISRWWQRVALELKVQTELNEPEWLTAKVLENHWLNPLTPERAAHHIRLKLDSVHYFAGDLLEVLAEGTDTPRTYSIASCSHTNSVDLLVRKVIKDNGEFGLASGYLAQLTPGQAVKVAFREHPNFHLPGTDVPLILIAAGTGLAPFIAFLQQRARDKNTSPCWLFMGERHPQQDNYFSQQLDDFQQQEILTKRFHAWSKNGEQSCYISSILEQQAESIRELVLGHEAHIYICGNAKGFGESVLTCLEHIFAHHWSQSSVQQKIKKDLY